MSGLKLYTYPHNKNAWKALIAAEYVGTKIEVPAFEMGVTNKSPEFLKLNPIGKVGVVMVFRRKRTQVRQGGTHSTLIASDHPLSSFAQHAISRWGFFSILLNALKMTASGYKLAS